MRFLLLLTALAAAPAIAGPADDLIRRGCGIEILPRARAACIGALADGRLLAIETRLSGATAGIQGATGPTLRAFEKNLAALQKAWQDDLRTACPQRDPVARQTCRLERILARSDQVDTVLETAFAPLGGVPGQGFRLPGQVDVEVPVRVPGFDEDLSVTIPVPLPQN